jgi:PAS domain S-box-containing protein
VRTLGNTGEAGARPWVKTPAGLGERWSLDLLRALPAAIYATDAEGTVMFYNDAAAELAGRRPRIGRDKWCVSWKLYEPDGTPLPLDRCPMAIALKEQREVRGVEAIVERPDGTRIPVMPYPTLLRDEEGRVAGAVNMLADLSESKEAERLKKALLDELNHRVKNALATVQGMAAHSMRDGTEAMRTEFDARLIALSRAHDHLTRQYWASADLRRILEDTFDPYEIHDGVRIRLEGAPVRLPPKAALLLAMVFHELATNAAKFGALSGTDGHVDVTWSIQPDEQLSVMWHESGGPDVHEPERPGFGMRLLSRGVADELGGAAEIRFDPGGVNCHMEVPLRPERAI